MTINIEKNYYNFAEPARLSYDNNIPKEPLEVLFKKGAFEKSKCYKWRQGKSAVKIIKKHP